MSVNETIQRVEAIQAEFVALAPRPALPRAAAPGTGSFAAALAERLPASARAALSAPPAALTAGERHRGRRSGRGAAMARHALFVGRRWGERPNARHQAGCKHGRLRLFRPVPVRTRTGRSRDPADERGTVPARPAGRSCRTSGRVTSCSLTAAVQAMSASTSVRAASSTRHTPATSSRSPPSTIRPMQAGASAPAATPRELLREGRARRAGCLALAGVASPCHDSHRSLNERMI